MIFVAAGSQIPVTIGSYFFVKGNHKEKEKP
jgi:hypothetical protein